MSDLDARIRAEISNPPDGMVFDPEFGEAERRGDALRAVLDLLSYTEERVADEPYGLSPNTVGVVSAGVRQAIARALGVKDIV